MRHPLVRLSRHLEDLTMTLADARAGAVLARSMAGDALGMTQDGAALVEHLAATEQVLRRLQVQAWHAMTLEGWTTPSRADA